jgi:DNA-binding beta-propeller fold protein YncE
MMKRLLLGVLLIAVCAAGCGKATVTHTTTGPKTAQSTLAAPDGLATDAQGNVYAVSSEEGNVQKFDSTGKLIATWGSSGEGPGQLKSPKSIAVDPSGNIFVADESGGNVQELDSAGKFVAKWSPEGGFNEQPKAVAANPNGGFYVIVGGMEDSVQKVDGSGKFVTKIGSPGTGKGQFVMPKGIGVDSAGNLYVGEPGASFSWTKNGKTVSGKATARVQKFDTSGKCISSIGGDASGDGNLGMMQTITVDGKGNIYVLEMNDVKEFAPSGKLLIKWGDMGQGQGSLWMAKSIAVDPQGNVYVGDSVSHRIQKFDSSGKFLTKWNMK